VWLRTSELTDGESWSNALGRAMCVAQNFEMNARFVLMVLEMDRALERGDYSSITDARPFIEQLLASMLGPAVRRFDQLGTIEDDKIAILSAAKDARNYFAHEGGHPVIKGATPKSFQAEAVQF
jgi:hypothetical protein